MEYKDFIISELKAEETGVFEGRLAVYGIMDEQGDICEPGCFTKTLREGSSTVPLLWSHDQARPIGALQLRDSPTALVAHGKLTLSVQAAREAYELMKAGAVRGLSIGYRVVKDKIEGEARRLKELRLYEGSLVAIPANPLAIVTGVKQQEPDIETLEAFRNASRDLKRFYREMID